MTEVLNRRKFAYLPVVGSAVVFPESFAVVLNYCGQKGLTAMGRPVNAIPTFRLHAGTGQAVTTVWIAGVRKDVYLGKHGSPEAIANYGRLLVEMAGQKPEPAGTTIAEVCLAYLKHVQAEYGRQDLGHAKQIVKALRELAGHEAAAGFGPKKLRALREVFVSRGWCRQLVNRAVSRTRALFKWAVAEELIPGTVLEALRAVEPLKPGKSKAPEATPIRPVADATVEATLPYLSPTVAAMVRFQRATGARPGEVCQLRLADLDRSGDVWVYRPRSHKNHWRGKERTIAVGPRAQAALAPLIEALDPEDYVFSPLRAVEQLARAKRANRRTPVQPSQQNRKTLHRKRPPRQCYDSGSYANAIRRAVRKASRGGLLIAPWHPNQLRHARATELRKVAGIDAAQVALGHTQPNTTAIYAAANEARSIELARQTG